MRTSAIMMSSCSINQQCRTILHVWDANVRIMEWILYYRKLRIFCITKFSCVDFSCRKISVQMDIWCKELIKYYYKWEGPRDQDSEAWRSSKELPLFEDAMCIRKYGRQLLEKSWCVWDNPTTVTMLRSSCKRRGSSHQTCAKRAIKTMFAVFEMRRCDILCCYWRKKVLGRSASRRPRSSYCSSISPRK